MIWFAQLVREAFSEWFCNNCVFLWDLCRNFAVTSRERCDSQHQGLTSQLPRMFATVKALNAAKVPILVGTDSPMDNIVPGISVHDELKLLVRAGLTPEEALAAGTIHAAKRLGLDKLGEIKEGMDADVVGVETVSDLLLVAP